MKKTLFLMITAIVCMASCKTSVLSLDNQIFRLIELNGTALIETDEVKPSISFEAGRVNASVGCNSIFAIYKTEADGKITFSEGGATKMMCPQELREEEFLGVFNKVARYTYDNNEACFYDADDNLLFKAAK